MIKRIAIPLTALLCAVRLPAEAGSAVLEPGRVMESNEIMLAGATSIELSERPAESDGARRLQRAPRAGFGIQYWGENYTADGLAAAPHCALIIEASMRGADSAPEFRETLFTKDEVARIRHGGARPAFAYLNVGEVVPYRDYWVAALGTDAASLDADIAEASVPAWYGTRTPAGDRLAAYWTAEWEDVLRLRIDEFLARGYDGVFLDDVLHYYTWSHGDIGMPARLAARESVPGSPAEFAAHMMSLVIRLSTYARRDAPLADAEFAVIVNGGAFIGWDASSGNAAPNAPHPTFEPYVSAIDAISIESALGEGVESATIDALQQSFAARGVAVLTIDYASASQSAQVETFRDQIRRQAQSLGFLPYVASDARFDRLDPPLLAGPAAAAPKFTAALCGRSAFGYFEEATGPR